MAAERLPCAPPAAPNCPAGAAGSCAAARTDPSERDGDWFRVAGDLEDFIFFGEESCVSGR